MEILREECSDLEDKVTEAETLKRSRPADAIVAAANNAARENTWKGDDVLTVSEARERGTSFLTKSGNVRKKTGNGVPLSDLLGVESPELAL